jgi:hypothetical protein
VGKTALVEHLLRTGDGRRTAAIKISAHRHAPSDVTPPLFEEDIQGSPDTQTGRFLAAGAWRAWLCRRPTPQLPDAARFIRALQDRGCDVIVESNRIVDYLVPDLVLFVVSSRIADWKASPAACLRRADALVLSPGTAEAPVEVLQRGGSTLARLPTFAFTGDWCVPGLAGWLPRTASEGGLRTRHRRGQNRVGQTRFPV